MILNDLYNEMILDYSRSKKHHCKLENATASQRGTNPSCGDDINLSFKMQNNIIEKICIEGNGCAISMASVEVMTNLLEGKTVDEARQLSQDFIDMIKKTNAEKKPPDALEEALLFENISNMPARVKCAVLPWHTFLQMTKTEQKD